MAVSSFRVVALLIALAVAPSWAINFQTIYTFPADKSTGKYPEATLTEGPEGNLYGTATQGGLNDAGTAFKISPGGTFTLLGSFDPATTGKSPTAKLLNIGDSFLYGAAREKTNAGGTVFRLNPDGGIEVIHNIPVGSTPPQVPLGLVSGESGVLHVVCSAPGGVIRVPIGGGLPTTPTVLDPSGSQGMAPTRLVRGTDGRLYGTTRGIGYQGAPPVQGTIFRVDADGSNFTTLFGFNYATSGAGPEGAMAVAPDGVMYGVTKAGGSFGDGMFFKFDPSAFDPGTPGSGYTALKNLDDIPSSIGDLLLASDNKIYGTSLSFGFGCVWRINRDGTGFQIIHSFNGTNGGYPHGGLIQAADGFLYGMTQGGSGATANGTIYKIDLDLPAPPTNHKPVAVRDNVTATNNVAQLIDVRANDFDADQDSNTLVVTIVQAPTKGTAVVQNGKVLYTPTSFVDHDEFQYRITDAGGLDSEANVIITDGTNPAAFWQTGAYNGILNLDPELEGNSDTPKGQLIINVSAINTAGLRSFTGKLFTNRARVSVRGVIDNDVAIARISLPKLGKANLLMTPGQGNIVSAFVFGKQTWSGLIAPLAPGTPGETTQFTSLFPADGSAAMPAGYGFGFMKVLPTGVAAIVGKLGDGSKLTCGTTVVTWNGDLRIPICAAPVKDGGFAGYFALDSDGVFNFLSGDFRWIRPPNTRRNALYSAGILVNVEGFAIPFVPVPKGSIPMNLGPDNTGFAEISGPHLPTPVLGSFVLNGSRLVCTAPLRSLSINRSTGIFTGKIKDTEGKTLTIQGAIDQQRSNGAGQYFLKGETGKVIIVDEL